MSKKKTEAGSANNHHPELLKELWEAAVNLRGSVEPADYSGFEAR